MTILYQNHHERARDREVALAFVEQDSFPITWGSLPPFPSTFHQPHGLFGGQWFSLLWSAPIPPWQFYCPRSDPLSGQAEALGWRSVIPAVTSLLSMRLWPDFSGQHLSSYRRWVPGCGPGCSKVSRWPWGLKPPGRETVVSREVKQDGWRELRRREFVGLKESLRWIASGWSLPDSNSVGCDLQQLSKRRATDQPERIQWIDE